ncbi:MAG: Uncharacterized protein G01um10147_761 [Microgenomates group bacterium Gr01-1014_7]|nr:MAG: Uncharacterized protein G01um10147_761 [Microgenomates group bacterium Gr01-1014_7]
MSLVIPKRIRIEKDVIIRIRRSLKGAGVLNVKVGQEVSPAEVLGTAQVSAGFRTINLADLLKVSPKDVEKYMRRTLSQRIYRGELLAYRSSFFEGKKIVTSPSDGVLDFMNPKTGELRLKFLPKKEDLPAGVFGVVEMVDKQKGQIVIRTQASVVHGMFGSGRVRDGTLHVISKRDQFIDRSFISPKEEEHILVGGSLVFKDAITSSISSGISGIITGGINVKDYKGMAGGRLIFPKKLENDIGVSILVCEGFGSVSIGEDIYEILKAHDGKFASIDGNKGLLYLPSFESGSLVKVTKVSLPPIQDKEFITPGGDQELWEIKEGLQVRIIGNSFPAEQGKVLSVDKTETLIPSGLRAFMALVETKRRKVKVPVANLEIIV